MGQAGDDAGGAMQDEGFDSGGKFHASGCEKGVGFGFREDSGALVGTSEATVFLDVLELAIHAGDERVVRDGTRLGEEGCGQEKYGGKAHDCILYEHGRFRRVAISGRVHRSYGLREASAEEGSGTTRGLARVPLTSN